MLLDMREVREASEHARNRNEWGMVVMQFWLASAVATGLPYRGNPVVGAVGEMTSVKWRKLWKTGEDGLCCSSSAIQTWLGPSSLLEERSKTPIVFVSLCVVGYPPNWGKRPRYIDIDVIESVLNWQWLWWDFYFYCTVPSLYTCFWFARFRIYAS